MNRFLALAAALCLAAGLVPAQAQGVHVRDFDVYVDLPTGFAYIKTPMGWKFIRRLDEAQLAQLPPSTLTTLLPRDEPELRYAHPALELSPRRLALREQERRAAARTEAVPSAGG